MSKENSRQFPVRLNLNRADHGRAWERLQARGDKSYTDAIVDALCRDGNDPGCARDPPREIAQLDRLRQLIREELSSFFRENPLALTKPEPREAGLSDNDAPVSEEDLNASLDFIDAFL